MGPTMNSDEPVRYHDKTVFGTEAGKKRLALEIPINSRFTCIWGCDTGIGNTALACEKSILEIPMRR